MTFLDILAKIFGSKQERDVKKLYPVLERINNLRETVSALSDEELSEKTGEFRRQLIVSTLLS